MDDNAVCFLVLLHPFEYSAQQEQVFKGTWTTRLAFVVGIGKDIWDLGSVICSLLKVDACPPPTTINPPLIEFKPIAW